LEFANGALSHDGTRVIVHSTKVSEDRGEGTLSVDLGEGMRIVPVNCYRTLVKIALSVVSADQLPFLQRTIRWLRYEEHAETALPSVATAIVPLPPNPSAQITLYVRKTENSRLPYIVAEFRLGCFVYVYVLPLSSRDSWDLVGLFDDPLFRETFRHYASTEWAHQDLSGQQEVQLRPVLKFEPRIRREGAT
jgi:hypothetical protein